MFLNSTDDVRYDINFASSDRAYDNLTSWTNRLGALDMVCPDHWKLEGKVGSTQYGSALVSGRTWLWAKKKVRRCFNRVQVLPTTSALNKRR